MISKTDAPIVAVVGYSDSGKTAVAEGLIELLTSRGHRVGASSTALTVTSLESRAATRSGSLKPGP